MPATDPRRPSRASPKTDEQKGRDKRKTDKVLEEGLEDTFPASDPPSVSSPGSSIGWKNPEEPENKG